LTFITAVVSGHYYEAFVIVLAVVVLAITYLGPLKNCIVM